MGNILNRIIAAFKNELTRAFIRKDGPAETPWCIYSKSGERLECKETETEAKKRLRQIEYFAEQGD